MRQCSLNLKMEINKEGKRGKHSRPSTKRIKTSDDIENPNMDKFIKACKGVSQNAYFNYNKRLKLLSLPNCNTCKQSSTEPSAMSHLVENFVNEVKVNMWYEALETCYYSITPTQYLPENVLMGIVEIILNARQNISTKYSMVQIINKCQQILSYHFNMHPPCKSHRGIMKCYKNLLIRNEKEIYVEVIGQKYSKRNDFGYTNGIIQYCFNRLEHEISAESVDDPLYSKVYIDLEYEKTKYAKVETNNYATIHRLSWEQENFEIYEMLNRTERINRLMATLYSMLELIQLDIYQSIRNEEVNESFLYSLCEISTENEMYKSSTPLRLYVNKRKIEWNKSKLVKQIMKMFAYLIHLDYPEDHIKTMTLWLNAVFEVSYLTGENLIHDFPKYVTTLTNLENQFYEIIKKLPHKSIIKILQRIEPSYMKYYMSRKYINKNLNSPYDNVIKTIHTFINESNWLKFPETYDRFIPNEINIKASDIKAKDILEHLSQICKSAKFKCNQVDRYLVYEKFDEKHLSNNDEMTRNDIIKALYISLVALLDAYNVQKVHQAVERNTQDELIETVYEVTSDLEAMYKTIYMYQNKLIELLKEQEAAGKLPKFLECFKIIYI